MSKTMNRKKLMALLITGCLASSCLKQKEDATTGPSTPTTRSFDWVKIADSAQLALNNFFWNGTGGYYTVQMNGTAFNGNYWPNAHALDVLIDQYLRKNRDAATKTQMDRLVAGLKAANGNTYINYYYDDMEWLLISSLRAFKETNDTRYKAIYDQLWPDVKGGWDNISGGGFYWRKDRINKNTPANAPACIFAARLYQLTNNADDLTWARNTYTWLKTQMIQANGTVWDGLNTNVTPITYDTRLFTYNYGTVIGSALELYKITNESRYIDDALQVAGAAVSALTRDGVLVPGDTGDGGLFNGIFVRYLTRLIVDGNIPAASKTNFINFLKKNAETMWVSGTIQNISLIGPDWKTTPTSTTLTPQLSGVMVTEAMAELKKLNLIP
jgi:predicted alpha-1,6-mannanase (GH76 family)